MSRARQEPSPRGMHDARVWVAPAHPVLQEAVLRGGGTVAPLRAANAIVCAHDDVDALGEAVAGAGIGWVQLGAAGIEMWLEAGVMRRDIAWTAAKGVYARPVAEHALALILAAARLLPERLRATRWGSPGGRLLREATVGIVGAGGIGRELLGLLAAFEPRTIALTRDGRDVAGAAVSLGPAGLDRLLAESDFVVLAAPATTETAGMISADRLLLLGPQGWLVNVARGSLVDTEALVRAAASGTIGGAALDATEPEPLPEGHPLWGLPNVIVTPHVASTLEMGLPLLARRVEDNVRRFVRGEPLLGLVDLSAGY